MLRLWKAPGNIFYKIYFRKCCPEIIAMFRLRMLISDSQPVFNNKHT